MSSQDEWMPIGRVAGAFGLRGEIKVEPLTDFPERFKKLDTAYLGTDFKPYRVERSRAHKSHILLKLEGVDTPEAVDRLRGEDVSVPRSEAVALPEGHFFLSELVGMSVVTVDGKAVGTVSDVLRTGVNDVYVVGSGKHEVLVPAIRDAVKEVDLEGRRIVIEPWVLEPE